MGFLNRNASKIIAIRIYTFLALLAIIFVMLYLVGCANMGTSVGINIPIGGRAGVGVSVGSDGRIGGTVGVGVGGGSVSVGTSGQLPSKKAEEEKKP